MKVRMKALVEGVELPKYAKNGDAAVDMVATSVRTTDDFIEYGTGIAVEIPAGHAGLLMPRSSNSKYDLLQCNSIGLIDSGYRGELMFRYKATKHDVVVNEDGTAGYNLSDNYTIYNVGDKCGQLMIIPYPEIEYEFVEELAESERGTDGFGSTGK